MIRARRLCPFGPLINEFLAVVSLPGGTWRTRHLRIKGAWLQEQVVRGWIVTHLPGAYLCADALTKALPRERFHLLLRLCELAALPRDRAAAICNTESLRRALVVVIVAACAQGAAGQPDNEEETSAVWWFWVMMLVVVALAWEGVKVGCALRHNGGTRYVPCKHCLPGVRNRRGSRGG